MFTMNHYEALKKYIGERDYQDESTKLSWNEIEVHRCHFRITESDKLYILETAAKMKWSANRLCNVMIEKCLPLIETALFRSDDKYDYEVIIPRKNPEIPMLKKLIEHHYEVGDFNQNLFVTLDRETFLMMQYLKEQLHFYSYGELFRLIIFFFWQELNVEDCNNEEEAVERLRKTVGKIYRRLEEFRGATIQSGTIVQTILRRVRATSTCLFPETQIFLEKMVI